MGGEDFNAKAEMELVRPGIVPQKTGGSITSILLMGGNEKRACHQYNINEDKWYVAGKLPVLHTVTEQISVQYNDEQTITHFVMINFEKNCFQLNMAVNNGVVGKDDATDWNWLAKIDLDGED